MEKEKLFSHRKAKKWKMFKLFENQRNHSEHSLQRDTNLLH